MTAFILGLWLAFFLGLIPASIARLKGRSYFWWWLYGVALFIIALPHILSLPADRAQMDRDKAREGYGRCPDCAEMVRKQAIKCRYCQSSLVDA